MSIPSYEKVFSVGNVYEKGAQAPQSSDISRIKLHQSSPRAGRNSARLPG